MSRQGIKTAIFSIMPLLMLLLFLAILEIGARYHIKNRPVYWTHNDRLYNPAYTSKPWFCEDFLIASFSQPGGWITPAGTRLVFPIDVTNRYFTVTNNVRRTVGYKSQSDLEAVDIYLLGGSTTYCSEVPDTLTWASQLQALLNEEFVPNPFRIINYGVTTVNSAQEVERLRYEIAGGKKPYAVIFYNGVNDVYQGVRYGNPSGTIFETAQERQRHPIRQFMNRSAFIRLCVSYGSKMRSRMKESRTDMNQITRLAERTAECYERNILEASQLCDLHKIRLFVMLQPNLYTIKRQLTKHESEIMQRIGPERKRTFDVAYPMLKRKIVSLKKKGIMGYDMTDVFEKNRKPIFLDDCHVESDGNAIIAQEVMKRIRPEIKKYTDEKR